MKYVKILAIEYVLPAHVETNQDLAQLFPEWTMDKIESKTGITQRHIANVNETAGDLAYQAAEKLFSTGKARKKDIDFVLLCTESPDYVLPATACVLQDRLQLPVTAGAFDFNLGCSGYIYGLSIAKGLIESGQAQHVLLLTSDTYSKYVAPNDKSVRTIFSDGATATYLQASDQKKSEIMFPCFGTDGSGHKNLIVHKNFSEKNNRHFLYMNGPKVFDFTLRVVPDLVNRALNLSKKTVEEVDYYIFHQANGFMLEHLREKLGIPKEKFCIDLQQYGNTVSSTIPIALSNAVRNNKIMPDATIMLVGFGVGYSWGSIFFSARSMFLCDSA